MLFRSESSWLALTPRTKQSMLSYLDAVETHYSVGQRLYSAHDVGSLDYGRSTSDTGSGARVRRAHVDIDQEQGSGDVSRLAATSIRPWSGKVDVRVEIGISFPFWRRTLRGWGDAVVRWGCLRRP